MFSKYFNIYSIKTIPLGISLKISIFLSVLYWIPYSFPKGKINKSPGLPWWRNGWGSACQCRGRGFEPWSGKIPHAAEQLGPWATAAEPARLEPVLRNKRGRDSEARAPRWRVAPACRNWRKPSHRNEDPTQPKINKLINKNLKKKKKSPNDE